MIVVLFENSRCTCDSDPIHLNAPGVAQEVNIWSKPASMIKLPQMIRGLMIPTDDDRQYGRRSLARIIFMEVTHAFILLRHRHRLEVAFVSDSLEISANQEQIYFVLLLRF